MRGPALAKLRGGLAVGVAVGVLAGILAYERPSVVERGEDWTYDLRVRNAASKEQASKDIVLIDVAEQDIRDVERNLDLSFPWPRALYGYLTKYVASGKPKAIIFDWFFQGRGALGVNDAAEFADAMKESGRTVIGVYLSEYPHPQFRPPGQWGGDVRKYPDRKEALAGALKVMAFDRHVFLSGGTLILGGEESAAAFAEDWQKLAALDELADVFPRDGENPAPPPPARELSEAEQAGELNDESFVAEIAGIKRVTPLEQKIPELSTLDPPLPILAAAAAGLGNVVQKPDEDGVMRLHMPFQAYKGRLYPSLSLAAWMVTHPGVTPRLEERALVLGDRRLPVDEKGRFVLRYHGDHKVYAHYGAYDLLRSFKQTEEGEKPSIPAGVFKDKYVVVSATANALVDVRVSPVARLHLGAAINATALDNLVAGVAVRRMEAWQEGLIAFSLALVLAVLMVLVWSAIRATAAALIVTGLGTVAALGGYWLWADHMYAGYQLWVAAAVPMGGGALAVFSSLLVASALERSDKRFVEKALNRYTSKALTREIMAHPEYLALGGARREISVYFSDIAGFTTISEKLSAEQLVDLLNEYLTCMTDIIDEHDGYVDKYIGDAVMAFWGGLIPDSEHARKGIRAAIAMRNECLRRAPDWKERYGVEVLARSGLNSGAGVVGNMGSQNKYNYTAMGDMVNVASRLEGANKPYGTYLMISETTYAHVKDMIDARELDFMTVKGKELPITVYEVLELRGKTDEATLAAVAKFHEGLKQYRGKLFAEAIATFEAACAARGGDDPPSKMYIERCKHFMASPPPEKWDGVWHMKEK